MAAWQDTFEPLFRDRFKVPDCPVDGFERAYSDAVCAITLLWSE